MRFTLFVLILVISTAEAKAQYSFQRNNYNNQMTAPYSSQHNHNYSGKKWFVSKYIGMQTSVGFYNGGNITAFSAPMGLQLNRKLNNNWYAFAGISATPAYIGFNHSFIAANSNKLMQPNSLNSAGSYNLFPKAELGLMYINDQKTFSISGRISVEKSNYSFAPFNQLGALRSTNFNNANW